MHRGSTYVSELEEQLRNVSAVTHKVWFDVEVGGKPQRVTFGLFGYAAPRAVENFVAMSECSKGEKYCYRGAPFHRVVKDFLVQGGDVGSGDGKGRVNIYDRPYADDVFALGLMHDRAGLLISANTGPDSNGGQFVVMMAPAPQLNGRHVVMGKVLEGLSVIEAISNVELRAKTEMPQVAVEIVGSGTLQVDKPGPKKSGWFW